MRTFLPLTLTGSALFALACGCGLGEDLSDQITEKVSEEIAEEIVEKAVGAEDLEVSRDGASVRLKTEDGEVAWDARNGKLPEGFPLPVYAGATIVSGAKIEADDKDSFQVSLRTPDAPEKVAGFYKQALEGDGFAVKQVEISADGKKQYLLDVSAPSKQKKGTIIVASKGDGSDTDVVISFYDEGFGD